MHVIEFKEDGTAETLYTDLFGLRELGSLNMKRASTIEWSEHRQRWAVIIDSDIAFTAPSRGRCLEWEYAYFNEMLLRR